MSDLVEAFKQSLLANGPVGVQFKDAKAAKVAFPSIVKELHDYVNSKDYLMLMYKDCLKIEAKKKVDALFNFYQLIK